MKAEVVPDNLFELHRLIWGETQRTSPFHPPAIIIIYHMMSIALVVQTSRMLVDAELWWHHSLTLEAASFRKLVSLVFTSFNVELKVRIVRDYSFIFLFYHFSFKHTNIRLYTCMFRRVPRTTLFEFLRRCLIFLIKNKGCRHEDHFRRVHAFFSK